ncbi:ATP-binding cassette domain-containing protein [Corticibacter populi]|uniref:ATP-binding cassette domain-containing protein n=2 Tax=Corticibacter populi TaxID=1550736 RepID=A0A3M6QHS6_9BURK|nr:ATP-binding cassette domain-containing protein [Corticibacter populi]RMX02231.1 ATP-binding cassette domain-containing protein [Corticibacter populi]RZS29500.1 sulfonate transport system ATP-binding protein [Corticibacter populi]
MSFAPKFSFHLAAGLGAWGGEALDALGLYASHAAQQDEDARTRRAQDVAGDQDADQTSAQTGVRLQLTGASKRFGEREVLHPLDLHVAPGEFVAIVGRSGCGKSTLLRLVAGLESPSAGTLELDGAEVHGLNPQTRIMFQDARLLPWKSVEQNVALGLPRQQRARALEVLAEVGLGDRGHEWPANLSGGQRQRVALARALVHQPRLLLLDEPLGALDALTRIEMHALIEGLWQQLGFTALLVTHDVQEAVALADRVLLIEDGAIALDLPIELPHPRERGSAAFAELEKRILDRVLATPSTIQAGEFPAGRLPPRPPLEPAEPPYHPAPRWQWAI